MHGQPGSREAEVKGPEFFRKTLDALLSHVAILDREGTILAVNAAWDHFATANGGTREDCGAGANYLRVCDLAAAGGLAAGRAAAEGIRSVIAGRWPDFALEYPCPAAARPRWYCMRATRFEIDGHVRAVVTHDDITQRKLAEDSLLGSLNVLELRATTDSLTGLPNRGAFDLALTREWGRHLRDRRSLTVALLDVDCFKRYNDHEGHLAGDDCLRSVAGEIRSHLRRGGDLAARYGGEEFGVILPGTDPRGAARCLRGIVRGVRRLAIPHPTSTVARRVITICIGAATTIPDGSGHPLEFLRRADEALYAAKAGGRDRLARAPELEFLAHAEAEASSPPAPSARPGTINLVGPPVW